MLGSATHKSKREIEELVCALKPRPDTPIVVRRLPTPRAVVVQPLAAVPSVPSATQIGVPTPAAVECRRESLPEPQPAPVSIAPPAPERDRIQLTVSRETRDRFRRPGAAASCGALGDAAEIFDRTVTLLVDQLSRVSARPSTTVSVERCLQNLPIFWHRGCSIDIQLRSVAVLEGRQTTHPPDGGRYLAPDRHVRTVQNLKGTGDSSRLCSAIPRSPRLTPPATHYFGQPVCGSAGVKRSAFW